MAMIIWVGSSALFFVFESNNPNFRECNDSIPLIGTKKHPGCYDFESTAACNEVYPGMCNQSAFTNMPSAMYYVAVFLGGEWGVVGESGNDSHDSLTSMIIVQAHFGPFA
jgi:hypothetical protein